MQNECLVCRKSRASKAGGATGVRGRGVQKYARGRHNLEGGKRYAILTAVLKNPSNDSVWRVCQVLRKREGDDRKRKWRKWTRLAARLLAAALPEVAARHLVFSLALRATANLEAAEALLLAGRVDAPVLLALDRALADALEGRDRVHLGVKVVRDGDVQVEVGGCTRLEPAVPAFALR